MCNRRNKPIIQGAVVLALVGGLGYTFYLYNLTLMNLEISRSEANKSLKQQESLSSQLQGQLHHNIFANSKFVLFVEFVLYSGHCYNRPRATFLEWIRILFFPPRKRTSSCFEILHCENCTGSFNMLHEENTLLDPTYCFFNNFFSANVCHSMLCSWKSSSVAFMMSGNNALSSWSTL